MQHACADRRLALSVGRLLSGSSWATWRAPSVSSQFSTSVLYALAECDALRRCVRWEFHVCLCAVASWPCTCSC